MCQILYISDKDFERDGKKGQDDLSISLGGCLMCIVHFKSTIQCTHDISGHLSSNSSLNTSVSMRTRYEMSYVRLKWTNSLHLSFWSGIKSVIMDLNVLRLYSNFIS